MASPEALSPRIAAVTGPRGASPGAPRTIVVSELVTYPVKSCAGTHLREAAITPTGIALDREFMLVDEENDFLSQRKVPELALVVPVIGERSITLTAPGMPEIELPLEEPYDDARLLTATVHEKEVTGQLVGAELDEWFTEFLPRYRDTERLRLLRVRADRPRLIKERYRKSSASNVLSFADGGALLLASERSLEQLNAEMDEPVPMNRFRPNIVVRGSDLEPYEEDTWTFIHIGALAAFVVKACDRCVIPDVNQRTAEVGKAVRRALVTRKGVNVYDEAQTGVFFAQNLNHVYEPGTVVRVGDHVEVLARQAQPNVTLASRRSAKQRSAAGKLAPDADGARR